MFVWEKKGRIFDPTGRAEWMQSHAQIPYVLDLGDRLRIYFTCRPDPKVTAGPTAVTAFADFEKEEPFKLIEIAENPVIELGGPGDFDQFGIMPGSIVKIPGTDDLRLYYAGWMRLEGVPYKWQIGMAVSLDGGVTFQRHSKGPILGTDRDDPYLQGCPRVERFNDEWVMFYISGTEWTAVDGRFESVYIMRRATSKDGIHWTRDSGGAIPTIVDRECQASATCVELDGHHHMFFTYRHGIDFRNPTRGYRIGHAVSTDLCEWSRRDAEMTIDVSDEGWDSEMVCYPQVVKLGDDHFMFYCGNEFGHSGFGYAKLARG